MLARHETPTAIMKANILFEKIMKGSAPDTVLCSIFLFWCLCVRYIPSLSFHGVDLEVSARSNPVCAAWCSAGLLSA